MRGRGHMKVVSGLEIRLEKVISMPESPKASTSSGVVGPFVHAYFHEFYPPTEG